MKKMSLPRVQVRAESVDATWFAPNDEDCRSLWNKYAMPKHIRAHSAHVAHIAHSIALEAARQGMAVRPDWVRSCGLLHDIAKAYTIDHGGSHAQLGAAWIVAETGNPALAQGIMHHVHWPWELDLERYFLPLVIIYADKRVKHDRIVPLDERFDDLLERYGRTEAICEHIRGSFVQAQHIEETIENTLGMALHACSFDSGRLV
ncbi:MAG: HDIG domain-containing protein [Pseudomonadota bacterium]